MVDLLSLAALAPTAAALVLAVFPLLPVVVWALPMVVAASFGLIASGRVPDPTVSAGLALSFVVIGASVRRHGRGEAVVAGLACGAYAVGRVLAESGHLFIVTTYRPGGDDFLTYESYARSILETNSLRGGENAFVYSPGFRYLLYAQHVVFGDGDRLQYAANTALLLFGCYWAWIRLADRPARDLLASLSQVIAGRNAVRSLRYVSLLIVPISAAGLTAGMVASPTLAGGASQLLSEYPTWTCLLYAIPLALTARRQRDVYVLSGLVGGAFLMRSEQGPGLLLLWCVGAATFLRSGRGNRKISQLVAPGVVLVCLFLLPALHNLVFAGTLALLPQTPRLPVNFPLPPTALLAALRDGDSGHVLRDQVAGLFIMRRNSNVVVAPDYFWFVRLVQVAWILAGVWVIVRRKWLLLLAVLVPPALLIPHLFIQVYVYYPRHVVAGYLAAAVVVLAVAGQVVSDRSESHSNASHMDGEAVHIGA